MNKAGTNNGHRFMSFVGDSTARTLYPAPALENVTSPQVGWGITTTASGSVFAGTSKDAIIYAVNSSSGIATLTFQRHAGGTLFQLSAGTSGIGSGYTFGPNGILIPGGFRIVSAATSDDWTIVFDVV